VPDNGTLYLVATPIGNLEDITLRALRVLKEVDLIACEDTRRTARLLHHYGISTPRQSYHNFNESSRTGRLIAQLQDGKNVALVSDAGTPLISDPGYLLVSQCRSAGIPVVPVPGASAIPAAISASGLPARPFFFEGFLPPRLAARRSRLQALASIEATLVFYEAPHRIVRTLDAMINILGDREACLVRELTKLHEEWITGSLNSIRSTLENRQAVRGDITLMVLGRPCPAASPETWPESIQSHIDAVAIREGLNPKEALKAVARSRGIPRREAYRLLQQEKESRKAGARGTRHGVPPDDSRQT